MISRTSIKLSISQLTEVQQLQLYSETAVSM